MYNEWVRGFLFSWHCTIQIRKSITLDKPLWHQIGFGFSKTGHEIFNLYFVLVEYIFLKMNQRNNICWHLCFPEFLLFPPDSKVFVHKKFLKNQKHFQVEIFCLQHKHPKPTKMSSLEIAFIISIIILCFEARVYQESLHE